MLGTQSLWSTIYNVPEDQLHDYIVRAGDTDLDVCWHNPNEEHGGVHTLFGQSHQVRTMMLGVPRQVHKVIEKEASLPRLWPRLKNLAFVHPFPSIGGKGPMSAILPHYMDDCIMPNLRHVSIIGYFVGWRTSQIFSSSLTHFHIQGHSGLVVSETSLIAMDSALDILRRMPRLESLVLADCFFLEIPEPLIANSESLVSLPELLYLRISSPAPMCTYVLGHLVTPSPCTLFIRFTMGVDYPFYDYESDEHNVVGALLAKLTSSNSVFRTAVMSTTVECGSGSQIRLLREACCSPSSLNHVSWNAGLGYPSSFHLVVETLPELLGYALAERGEIIASVFTKLPLSEVTSVFVAVDVVDEIPTHSLAAIANSLPKVAVMATSDATSVAMRRMLMIPRSSCSTEPTVQDEASSTPTMSDGESGFVFPSLQYLDLQDDDGFSVGSGVEYVVDHYIALIHVLRERQRGGHTLRSLFVSGMEHALRESPSPSMNRVNWIRQRVLASSGPDRDWNKLQVPPEGPKGVVVGNLKWSSADWFLSNGYVNLRAIYAADLFEADVDFEPKCSSSCLCRSLSF